MQINNADGGEVEACGNAMRAVARILLAESGETFVDIETVVGRLSAEGHADGTVTVDMGEVRTQWENIPLAEARDTLDLELGVEGLPSGVAVNVGNPHLVLFVADAEAAEVETLGPGLERHKLFPQRTNVEFVTVKDRTHLRMRVWERGVGVTRACGSGACAALVAAVRRDLAERTAWVELDGGHLEIEWRESDNHVLLTGPASRSFTGEIDPALLAG
jgi:diaminopimelate epimerase